MNEDTWLSRSHQTWKLIVFGILLILEFGVIVLHQCKINHFCGPLFKEDSGPTELLGWAVVVVAFIAFIWVWLAIRCSNCRKSVSGMILKTAPAMQWFTQLVTLQECPHCGSEK